MKKFLKRIGLFLLAGIIAANAYVWLSGRTYLYKALWNTYAKGRSGPSATEYKIFSYRTVANGTPDPWPVSTHYNQSAIPADLEKKMTDIATGSFLIIKNDSLYFEKYYGEFSDKSYTNSFSMAKTVVSILTGCAIADGYIKSVDDPVYLYLPEFANDAKLKKITIRHLLTMSSGIAFDEDYVSPFAYPAEAYYGNDLRKLTFHYKEVNEEPGKTFVYLSGNTQLLGFVLRKATGKTIADYASEKLWKPMGCEQSAFWSLDREDGDEKSFCCLNSNARDFARIGQLYLDSGRWKGKQLVPEAYALASVQPAGLKNEDGTPCVNYGYNWWMIPEYKGHRVFYARGILGQYVLVVPDMNMIIVRLGEKRLPNDSNDTPRDVYIYLDAALEM
ncbi:MAG: serine hydrolase [Bacteroidia bacterium]